MIASTASHPRPEEGRYVRYYFEPAFAHGGRTGPSVVVLVGPRWTPFLRTRMGLKSQAFFERAAMAHEPNTFPNGHPFAWVYRNPAEAAADEARWLVEADMDRFNAGLLAAHADLMPAEQLPLPGVESGASADSEPCVA